jgi:lipoic acid synthetase
MAYQRRPEWLKIRLSGGNVYKEVKNLVNSQKLHTVCQSARCPNIGECWSRRTATFMILGDTCTRNCGFCAVKTGKGKVLDPGEPEKVARSVAKLKLRHAVITSVTRDDLPDGGCRLFVKTIQLIRKYALGCSIEVLIPDFKGDKKSLLKLFKANPDILNHNLEVVPKLYPIARTQANFKRSVNLLKLAKKESLVTKTGIMIGLGEKDEEIFDLFKLLVQININILTIGQYLQPTSYHLPVIKYYHPDEFLKFKEVGESLGIPLIESGPLVRSSYHADKQKKKLIA